MFNFNINNQNEYQLYGKMTGEMIDLYGLDIKYIKTEKVNEVIPLSEIQNLRADNSSVFSVKVYPENAAGYDTQNDLLSKFGMLSFDTVNLFISYNSITKIHESDEIQRAYGDLVVLPSGKIFEITELESQVPGVNNLFTYSNQKNVFMIKCKPYNYNHDEISIDDEDIPDFSKIFDDNFREIEKQEQNNQSKVVKNLDSAFGDLG